MAKVTPRFRDHGQVHRADTCKPLIDSANRGEVILQALARGAYPGRPLPLNALPHLKSIGFWDADHAQNWGLPWHRNEGIELTYLETGEIAFAAEQEKFTCIPAISPSHAPGSPIASVIPTSVPADSIGSFSMWVSDSRTKPGSGRSG